MLISKHTNYQHCKVESSRGKPNAMVVLLIFRKKNTVIDKGCVQVIIFIEHFVKIVEQTNSKSYKTLIKPNRVFSYNAASTNHSK